MQKQIHYLVAVSLLFVCMTVSAQEKHKKHLPGMSHKPISHEIMPIEGGQSTFAAIIEIVALLEANPDTHWPSVDIDGLRSHLVDMDLLMLSTSATTQVINSDTVQYYVKGSGEALKAIHKMVAAHSRFIMQSREYDIETKLSDDGALVQIKANGNITIPQLKALGFYGFMSLDSHHQMHHLLIAKGQGH